MSGQKLIIDTYEIHLKNEEKILFPESNITKKDVISYYKDISSIAVPYYKNRPLTMLRCPNGISNQKFIQKEAPLYIPQWIETWELPKKEGKVRHILVNNAATLVYLANQACITFHLGLSEVNKIDYPTYLVFDLDPSVVNLPLLKKVAKKVRKLADTLELPSYIQTTGSRGFHIYIPLNQAYTFEHAHAFAKNFAQYLAQQNPEEITIEQYKEKRGRRVFIDYARNGYGLNAVAPYSVRDKETAPLAAPLYWEELEDKNLHSQSYNIKNIFKRMNNIQDPWAKIHTHSISLNLAEEKLLNLTWMLSAAQMKN